MKVGEELRFVLITSAVHLHDLEDEEDEGAVTEVDGLRVRVSASPGTKCARCWHYRADVGAHAAHPEICGRCVDNVDGSGEVRHYA